MKIKENISYIIVVCLMTVLLFMNGDSQENISLTGNNGFLIQHAGDTQEEVWEQTFVLEKGDYHFRFYYTTSAAGNEIRIYENGLQYTVVPIEPNGELAEVEVHLEEACSGFKVAAYYNGTGYLEIKSVECAAGQPWHRDNWLKATLFLAIVAWLIITRYMYVKHKLSKSNMIGIHIVFGLALLSSVLFFSGNKVGHGDDLNYHLSRIEGIADGLRNGQFPVMIYPKAFGENGYLNAMYPSLFLYIPACLRVMGVSFVTAYKVLLILINFATAFIKYGAMKTLNQSEKPAVLATAIYLFATYRLNNMLVRGALGETLAMVFLPLVLVGLYHLLVGDRKKWWMLMIGATGVIQSHILSSVMYAVIALLLVCFFGRKMIQEKRYVELFKCIIMIALLNIGFLVPFVAFYFKGNLNLQAVTQAYDMASGGLNPSYLFGIFDIFQSGFTDSHNYALNLSIMCLMVIAILYILFCRKPETAAVQFSKLAILMAVFLLFMATNWFPYKKFDMLNVFQFPWRFIGPAIGIIIIVGSICLTKLEIGRQEVNCIILGLVLLVVCDTLTWQLNWNDNIRGHEERDSQVQYRDSDIDKTSADILYWADEYFVQGTDEYLTNYNVSSSEVEVQGYAKNKLNVYVKYTVKDGSQQWIDFPLQNYIGYRAFDESGADYEIVTGEYGNIRVKLRNDGKMHEINILYKEPLVFRLAEVISLVTLIVYIAWIMIKTNRKVVRE